MNKKRHYALIKSGADAIKIAEAIFEKAQITEKQLEELLLQEQKTYYEEVSTQKQGDGKDTMKSRMKNASDSIRQIKQLLKILHTGDLELFDTALPPTEKSVVELIKDTLTSLKTDQQFEDFKVHENTGRAKYGIPKHEDEFDEIYLFDPLSDEVVPYPMNLDISLIPQINAISSETPYVFVYIVPNTTSSMADISAKTTNQIAEKIGQHFRERLCKAFPSMCNIEDVEKGVEKGAEM